MQHRSPAKVLAGSTTAILGRREPAFSASPTSGSISFAVSSPPPWPAAATRPRAILRATGAVEAFGNGAGCSACAAAWPCTTARPPCASGDALILYTDGLLRRQRPQR